MVPPLAELVPPVPRDRGAKPPKPHPAQPPIQAPIQAEAARGGAAGRLAALLDLESRMLGCASRAELRHLALGGEVSGAEFAGWVERRGGRVRLRATRHLGRADRDTPFAQWLERALRGADWDAVSRPALADAEAHTALGHALLAPFPGGAGGLIYLSAEPLGAAAEATAARLARLAGTCARASRRRTGANTRRSPWTWPWVAAAGLAGVLALPVPLTTLAPAEVVPSAPFHVTAPFDGVVEALHVQPYAQVAPGALLVKLEATRHRNAAALAEREEHVARAALVATERGAFGSAEARADVALARAEAELAAARRAYALDNLERTEVRAPRGGIAILADAESWTGRPVATGQTVLEIADPDARELLIRVPLSSGEPLEAGGRVRLYLDSDPARAVEAELTRAALVATEQPDGSLAFEARATLSADAPASARIGAHGVAKIYGGTAPLIWWLARKPVAALRQITGL